MENLVRACLYNWLGYGNLDGRIWFIGMEEGGAEIWRHPTRTLTESLTLRRDFTLTMDFRQVWEDRYGIPLKTIRGLTTWHFITAFLVRLEWGEVSSALVRKYLLQEKRLGRPDANHFFGELLPLPRQSHASMHGYESIWPTPDAYTAEVLPRRLQLFLDTLAAHPAVRLLVTYDRGFVQALHTHRPGALQDRTTAVFDGKLFNLSRLELAPGRSVPLLHTPFFGQGQVSYAALAGAADWMRQLAIL